MRLAPRFTAGFTVLALVAVGCGSSSVAYREVPGGPADLKVPGNAENFDAAATPTPTQDNGDTAGADSATADATPTPDTGTTDTTTAPNAANGTAEGGTEAPAGENTTPEDTAPTDGTPPPELEDYCANNPGAC